MTPGPNRPTDRRGRDGLTLSATAGAQTLLVDDEVAHAWATLRPALRDAGQRMPINDSWIAAVANDPKPSHPKRPTTTTSRDFESYRSDADRSASNPVHLNFRFSEPAVCSILDAVRLRV
jgi:hypothetical protein